MTAYFGKSPIRFLQKAFVLWALAIHPVAAQSTFGSIAGSVTDPTGAVVTGAKIEVKNQDTRVLRTALTDATGEFRVINLDAGTYTVSVSAGNFATASVADVPLLAREAVRQDFQLKLASNPGETLEVRSDSVVVSEILTQSDSKSGENINQLALNFRATNTPSPIGVAVLTPGVQTDSGGQISLSGGLPNSTSFSIDGISTQSVRNGGANRDLFPSVESIGEFKVNTAGNTAEFSQPTDITVTSKSGANAFHGSGFWFLQRDSLNARSTFAAVKPSVQADDFGATLGGPVTLPHLYDGRNKSFFFFTYEGIRRPQSTLLNEIVPPTPWRSGDLSSVTTPIIDPLAGIPFSGNKIPLTRLNPSSQALLTALFVQPNSATNTSIASPNYQANFPGDYSLDGFDGRFDQNLGAKHKFFFHISQKDITDVGNNSSSTYNVMLGPASNLPTYTNISGSHNWILRPNLINEIRLGWSRADGSFMSYPLAAQGEDIVKQAGILGLPGAPVNGLGGVPEVEISSFLGGTSSPGHPRVLKQHTFELGDSITWIRGTHSIKAGYEFRRYSYQDNITFLTGDEYGDYFFQGVVTHNDFADFLLGLPAGAAFAQNGPDGKPFGYHNGFFIQDDWRMRRNFTLNFGLRYEVNSPFDDETNQLGQFDRNFPGGRLITQGTEGLALVSPSWRKQVGNTPFVTNDQVGLPRTLRYTYFGNVQPRLGFSWSPGKDNKTIIRASSGFYSSPILGAVLYSLLGVNTSNFVQFTTSATRPLVLPTLFTGASDALGYPGYRRANQLDLRDPRVIQWNLAIDRDLGWKTLLRVSYTGSHTTGLIYSPDLNQLQPNTTGYAALTATPALRAQNLKYPNFAEVLTRDNGPSAKYEAMTVELSRRFSHDITFQNTYTLAQNLTNALGSAPNANTPNGGTTGGDNGGNVLNYYDIKSDYGDAVFTRRHRFVSTFLYALPFGRGKEYFNSASRAVDLAVGGWRLTGITVAQTGPFLTPTFTGTDPSGTNPSGRSEGSYQRADCTGASGDAANPTRDQWFNPAAFSVPGNNIGRFGNCGVGILHGPGTVNFSMSLGKDFHIAERWSFSYEAQFSNLFNITNLGIPNTRFSNSPGTVSASFGSITATQAVEQGGPRVIQMSLRLLF
jgi:hypothetical protein